MSFILLRETFVGEDFQESKFIIYILCNFLLLFIILALFLHYI